MIIAPAQNHDTSSGLIGALVDSVTNPVKVVYDVTSTASMVSNDKLTADQLEANRKATESRLQYTEQALSDAQNKLLQAVDSYERATQQYSQALQQQYNRHVAIDQLRIHIKQNILYYMQSIWNHEPPDQRYFRLYNLEITCPGHDQQNVDIIIPAQQAGSPTKPHVLGRGPMVMEAPLNSILTTLDGDKVLLKDIADLDNPIGYKGNYMIFPLKRPLLLTTFMLKEFINEYTGGIQDPDDKFTIEEFDQQWQDAVKANDQTELNKLKDQLLEYLDKAKRTTDDIIVPTGQLFIEALTGTHPLLEDFKLLHRAEDVRKVKAEVRHAELENLRLASRLLEDKLEDPNNEKRIVIEGNASVSVGTNS